MPRIAFATRLKQTEPIEKTLSDPSFQSLLMDVGAAGWKTWIQVMKGTPHLTTYLDAKDPDLVFQRLRDKISAKEPKALAYQKAVLDASGIDISDPSTEPKLTPALDLDFSNPTKEPRVTISYFLPLKPGKADEQINFCQRCTTSPLKEAFIEGFSGFGITRMQRIVQRSQFGDTLNLIIDRTQSSQDHNAELFEKQRNNAEWRRLSDQMLEYVDVTYEETLLDIRPVNI